MPQDRTLKAIKSRSRSEQVSVVSLLLLPLLGMCCLLIPDTVTDALPYLLGGLMAVSGAAGLVYAVAHASGARADARRLAEEPAVLGQKNSFLHTVPKRKNTKKSRQNLAGSRRSGKV